MNLRRMHVGLLVLAVVVVAGVGAAMLGAFDRAAGNIYVRGPANLAIDGYDTVAYFTEGRAVPGTDAFHHTWAGAEWRFASAETRDLFAADPARYAPAFGSYCAMGMAEGKLSEGDPDAWSIVDGRLYLKYDRATRDAWRANTQANIAAADANWSQFEEVF